MNVLHKTHDLIGGILMRARMKRIALVAFLLACVSVWPQCMWGQQPTATATPTPSPQQLHPGASLLPAPERALLGQPAPGSVRETQKEKPTAVVGMDETVGFSFAYVPPLSINDSIRLLRRCIGLLEQNRNEFVELRKEKVRDALTDVIEYIKTVDQEHSLLAHYKWYFVGRNKVSLGEQIDEDVYEVEPVLKGASAISFSAERGDVYVRRMKVLDANGAETNFKIDKWIDSGLPRKEICYLFFQTDIARIIVSYSARKNEGPRLSLYGGVTPMPEYAKEAIYYLAAARKATEQGNFSEATENIRRGWMRLLNYKIAQQL
jgi:hypothetical protein